MKSPMSTSWKRLIEKCCYHLQFVYYCIQTRSKHSPPPHVWQRQQTARDRLKPACTDAMCTKLGSHILTELTSTLNYNMSSLTSTPKLIVRNDSECLLNHSDFNNAIIGRWMKVGWMFVPRVYFLEREARCECKQHYCLEEALGPLAP